MYDFLIVGSGLSGVVFGRQMAEVGKKVLIIEQRNHIAGNVYTEDINGIHVHSHGPHLFRCNSKIIWDYVNRFAEFNSYQHKVKAIYDGKMYNLPFNMMTYNQMWGCTTPTEAQEMIAKQIVPIENPSNLEEWALANVGKDIYDKLVYGYTKKQWRKEPKDLPASIIKRLPLRMTFNDNYSDDKYQGIPIHGYTSLVANIIGGIEVKTNVDFFSILDWRSIAKKLVYTGPIDKLFNYCFGDLEYLTLEFEHFLHDGENFQGTGQINYTDEKVAHTRIIEHKHFYDTNTKNSVVTYEYPVEWSRGKTEYYPVVTQKNIDKYNAYKNEVRKHEDIIILGRLGLFKYLDMAPTILMALNTAKEELCK